MTERRCSATVAGCEYVNDRGGRVWYDHEPRVYTISMRHLELMAVTEFPAALVLKTGLGEKAG
jgi:hypothetical protein